MLCQWLMRFKGQTINIQFMRFTLLAAGKRETAYCLHLVIAALTFSPFLLYGETLFANTDLLLHNYPMMLLAKQQFLSGSLGLWNAYVFLGAPQSVAASTHILNPENWLLFLLPEQYFFLVYTFSMFVKLWLTGAISYHFFCAELLNRRWALFASLTYHMSGWVIWALISSVALSMYFYFTILLTLLWTSPQRNHFKNYLLFSLVLTMTLMTGNIAHASYAVMFAGILYIYRIYCCRNFTSCPSSLFVFASASITALLVFSIRLLPILDSLSSGSRNICADLGDNGCRSFYKDSSVLIARLFNTEIFGVNYSESRLIFKAISPVFSEYQIHGVMPAFFGIVAMFLALWALVSEKSSKTTFWSIGSITLLGLITFAKPFDEIGLMLFGNIFHPMGWHLILPVFFSVLASLGGMSLERALRNDGISRSANQLFTFFVCLALALILIILIRNIETVVHFNKKWSQLFIFGCLVTIPLLMICHHRWPMLTSKFFEIILWLLATLCIYLILIFTDINPTFTSHVKNLSISLLFFTGIAFSLHFIVVRGKLDAAKSLALHGVPCVTTLALVVFIYPWANTLDKTISHEQAFVLSAIGAVRLLLGCSIWLLLLSAVKSKKLPARSIYVLFILLLLCEQIPANKVHTYMNEKPFIATSNPYPQMPPFIDEKGATLKLDLKNYRVNFPNAALQLPFYEGLFGIREVCSSINAAYGVRSYGGFNNTIPNKSIWFVQNWEPSEKGDFCIYANHTNERFLDLSGVGYEYNPELRTITARPRALSRFMLYTQYELIKKNELSLSDYGPILDRLKESGFNPLSSIVLEEAPDFQSQTSSLNGKKIEFEEVNSDHIEINLKADRPALLFFNDSHNLGWAVEVNDVPVKVITADYLFMAVAVPAGDSRIILKYKPRAFKLGLYCSILGISIWMLSFITYLIRQKPKKNQELMAL